MPPKKQEQLESSDIDFAKKVARQMMKRYRVLPYHLDEFESAAYLGLVEAGANYTEDSGVPFHRFAYYRIRGAVIDSMRQHFNNSKRQVRYLKLLEAADCLSEDLCSIKPIIKVGEANTALAQALNYAANSGLLFQITYEKGIEETELNLQYYSDVEQKIDGARSHKKFERLLDKLPPKEALVIRAFYFEGYDFQEIAEDLLHVSRSWVSRIHSKALSRLRVLLVRESFAKSGSKEMGT